MYNFVDDEYMVQNYRLNWNKLYSFMADIFFLDALASLKTML